MSQSAVFGEKISQEKNKSGHISVLRGQCLWRLVSGLDYLKREVRKNVLRDVMYSLYFPISPFSAACYHICTAKVRIVHSSSSVHLALTLACTRARHTWEARTQARSDVTSQSNGHELTVS